MMNLDSVIRKTELGKQEVLSPTDSSLPRELRVILILIDGKKTVQNYYDSLSSKRFLSQYPSIEECFMVLESMELIEVVDNTIGTTTNTLHSNKVSSAPKQDHLKSFKPQSPPANVIAHTANETPPNIPSTNIRGSKFKDAIPVVAEFVESNLSEDCWSLMIQLEMVNNFEELTRFLQSISQKYKGEYNAAEFNKMIQKLNDLKNT